MHNNILKAGHIRPTCMAILEVFELSVIIMKMNCCYDWLILNNLELTNFWQTQKQKV